MVAVWTSRWIPGVVEDPQPQRTADRIDAVGLEFLHRGCHHGQAACQHRRPLRLQGGHRQVPDVAGRDHPPAQAIEAAAGDPCWRHAVLLEDLGQRQRRARRRIGAGPVTAIEIAAISTSAGPPCRLPRTPPPSPAVAEEALGHADAAHLQQVHPQRLMPRRR
jgi:hypothetical protein